MDEHSNVAFTMAAILGAMVVVVGGLASIQKPNPNEASRFLPCPKTERSKYGFEIFALCFTPFWIGSFALIILGRLYEHFDPYAYDYVCWLIALPLFLQPLFFPSCGVSSPDEARPVLARYSTKAMVWLAVYSFIGNYWFTHYFYSVLKAKYTMPGVLRLNDVPTCTFPATQFYFTTYHTFSNLLLRKVRTSFEAGTRRTLLYVGVVLVFSYFTAFTETLAMSAFPLFSFEDPFLVQTVGSAFYGMYFVVSYPAFNYFDDNVDSEAKQQVTVWDAVVHCCGYMMIIMCLLDFVRLYLDIPLVVGTFKW